jgi:hypothetical protein
MVDDETGPKNNLLKSIYNLDLISSYSMVYLANHRKYPTIFKNVCVFKVSSTMKRTTIKLNYLITRLFVRYSFRCSGLLFYLLSEIHVCWRRPQNSFNEKLHSHAQYHFVIACFRPGVFFPD